MSESSYVDVFWTVICRSAFLWAWMFSFALLFLIVLAVMFPFMTPGTGTYVITVVTLVALGLVAAQLGFILYKCRRMATDDDREPE